MTDGWAAALEATAIAGALRGSVWAYPLINTGHLLGIALLVGAILPLDLRLLGLWPNTALAPLWQVLTRTAGVGLGLAVVCGALLFVTRAAAYVESTLFLTKMALVGVGTVNALLLHLLWYRHDPRPRTTAHPLPRRVRVHALVSLLTWLTVLVSGRLIGYF